MITEKGPEGSIMLPRADDALVTELLDSDACRDRLNDTAIH